MKLTLPYSSQSSPNSKPHVATFDTDSRTSACTCRGFKSPSRCWHSRDIAEKYERGELSPSVIPFVPQVKGTRIEPMLASAMTKGRVVEDYATPQWIGEEKFDGDRQLTTVKNGQVVESRSRQGNTRTLPVDVREVMACLPDGIYDLEDMATRKTLGGDRDGRRVVLFDIVEVMGTRVTDNPLSERRAYLEVAYAHITKRYPRWRSVVCLSKQWPVTREAVDAIWASGGEGAILKRLASVYQPRARSADWIKVKRGGAVTVTLLGFEDGEIRMGRTRVTDAAGREFTVRTGGGNLMILRDVQSHPAKYLDRRLVLEYTEKLDSGAYRHPRWDHLASVTE